MLPITFTAITLSISKKNRNSNSLLHTEHALRSDSLADDGIEMFIEERDSKDDVEKEERRVGRVRREEEQAAMLNNG